LCPASPRERPARPASPPSRSRLLPTSRERPPSRPAAQGTLTQRQLLSSGSNTQASLADAHAPWHCGVSALPHETGRPSHDPVPTAAPHLEPGAQEPVHAPFLNVQPMLIA